MTKNEYVYEICKVGLGESCCRYLTVGSDGFECAKNTELKDLLDERMNSKTMVARGDNCNGDFKNER